MINTGPEVYVATPYGRLIPARVIPMSSKAAAITGINHPPTATKPSSRNAPKIPLLRKWFPRYHKAPKSTDKDHYHESLQGVIDNNLIVMSDDPNWMLSEEKRAVNQPIYQGQRHQPINGVCNIDRVRNSSFTRKDDEVVLTRVNHSRSSSLHQRNSDTPTSTVNHSRSSSLHQRNSDTPTSTVNHSRSSSLHQRNSDIPTSIINNCRTTSPVNHSRTTSPVNHSRTTSPVNHSRTTSPVNHSVTSSPVNHPVTLSLNIGSTSPRGKALNRQRDIACQTSMEIVKRQAPLPPEHRTYKQHIVNRIRNIDHINNMRNNLENHQHQHLVIPCTDVDEVSSSPKARCIVLEKLRTGYGFVLCGAKYKDKRYGDDFRPSKKTPALQYLSEVYSDGIAAKAGLKRGDFLLRINGEDVVSATHELATRLIKSSRSQLRLTVIAGVTDNVDSATLLSPASQASNKSFPYEDGTKTLPLPKRMKSPVLSASRMTFDIDTSPVLLNSLNNNNNVKQKNINNATASIRSRSSKKLTTVPLDEIFLQSHLISEQIANYKSLPRRSSDSQRPQPDILDNLYSKTLSSPTIEVEIENKGMDIPPPPSHRPPSPPPHYKDFASTERKYNILRELEKEQSTFCPVNNKIPNPPSMQAPCPPMKSSPPPLPPMKSSPPPLPPMKTSTTPIPPPPVLNAPKAQNSINRSQPKQSKGSSSAPPPPPPPPAFTSTPTPTVNLRPTPPPSTESRDSSYIDMSSMAAQIANISLKSRSQESKPTLAATTSSSSMSSDLMEAISRRRCIVDAPVNENDFESKIAAAKQKSNNNNNSSPKSRISTDGSPNLGFKALAEQRRQQWLSKQKVTKNEEVSTGEIAKMVAERAKRMTPLDINKQMEPKGHSTVFPPSPVSPTTARRIISENLHPPNAHLITDDSTSLASSGVASTFSSTADESPLSSRHKVYHIDQQLPSPVLLPPPAFADDSNKDSYFSSVRSALRSSSDDLSAL